MFEDVTVLIPIHRENGNREWLQQAINSVRDAKAFVLENDGELADAYNAGLHAADTEYVLLMDADDIAHPNMLHELRAAIWDVDVTYPELLFTDEQMTKPVDVMAAAQFCPMRLQQSNYIPGVALVRRKKALEAGGFRDLPALEDWDLWLRMHRAGARFKPVPAARLFYRQRDGSRSDQDVDEAVIRDIVGGDDPTADLPATFYYTQTAATAYVRCVLPARHLPGLALDGLHARFSEDDYEYPQHRGAAVFQLAADKTRAGTTVALQAKGHRVLVETDDNYVVEHSATAFRKKANWGRTIGSAPHSVQGHKWIVKQADGVIVSTPYLADRYRKLNPNVYVCPNTVDPADWQPLKKPDDGVFRIGWFASASHAGDGKLVARALEWASRQKNVEVVTLGYDPGWKFPYRRLPWATDLSAYRRMMQVLDVGVAPVVPSPFTLGRSDLKWLEYSMAGVATVCSDVVCYSGVEHAMKAADAKGFYRAVQHLVANRDEAKEMAAAAREHVLGERTTAAQIHTWREAIQG